MRVSFKCPSENNGVLEYLQANQIGEQIRFRITYDKTMPVAVRSDIKLVDTPFIKSLAYDFRKKDTDPIMRKRAATILARYGETFSEICFGSKLPWEEFLKNLDG